MKTIETKSVEETQELAKHADIISHLLSELNPVIPGAPYDADDELNIKNVFFIRMSDFEIDSAGNIIDPVSRLPYIIKIHLGSNTFWVENGS